MLQLNHPPGSVAVTVMDIGPVGMGVREAQEQARELKGLE
jgi:hypothetical protein